MNIHLRAGPYSCHGHREMDGSPAVFIYEQFSTDTDADRGYGACKWMSIWVSKAEISVVFEGDLMF